MPPIRDPRLTRLDASGRQGRAPKRHRPAAPRSVVLIAIGTIAGALTGAYLL